MNPDSFLRVLDRIESHQVVRTPFGSQCPNPICFAHSQQNPTLLPYSQSLYFPKGDVTKPRLS